MIQHAFIHLKGGKHHHGDSQPVTIPLAKWHKAANDEPSGDQPQGRKTNPFREIPVE